MPKDSSPGQATRDPSTLDVDERWLEELGPGGAPPAGSVVEGKYRVLRPVGHGGMGVVVLARDLRLERDVALKLVAPGRLSESTRELFLAEARAMATVRHENVVQVYDFGEHLGLPYLVMEYVPGRSVAGWLEQCDEAGALGPIDEALGILDQVCRGVTAVHDAGLLHGDLKPGNILLGPAFRAAVADFGFMRQRGVAKDLGLIAGTPAYIPPEMAVGDSHQPPDAPADVYALAATAYEMLTGELPLPVYDMLSLYEVHGRGDRPRRPSAIRPELPVCFDDVLLEGLDASPKTRTQTPDAFRRALITARDSIAHARSASVGARVTRVVVADDDEDFLALATESLRHAFPGAEIESVTDGIAALHSLEARPASLAVLDLDMPGMNGVELTATLRGGEVGAQLPIIVVTARGGAPDWRLLSALGANGFLVKPLDPHALVAMARRSVLGSGT
ncbi:MAG: protein kinase [Deltaproteobacteria bacterium]|nr:protein kinase [Deltaproteobacteria bacterium]